MIFKRNPKINQLIWFFILFFIPTQEAILTENDQKYFFTMYPSQNSQESYISYAHAANSEFLTINALKSKDVQIQKETSDDVIYKNISSILIYEKKYLIRTCFGPNKIMEVISQDDSEKKETQKFKSSYTSEKNFDEDNHIVFCYSSIIENPDNNFPDKKAIITFYTEIIKKDNSSEKEYSHKYILFLPDSQIFSNTYSLLSDNPDYFPKICPKFCTTFRVEDIYCTIVDEKYDFVIETSLILKNNENKASMFLIKSLFNIDERKNLKPIALNKEYKSLLGGYYDTFLLEYHNKEQNETFLYYSLYRKSIQLSLIPILNNSKLFEGINIKDYYIDPNFFNYIIPYSNEMILIYLLNNTIKATRVDYSKYSLDFRSLNKNNLGQYAAKIDQNCKFPKFMQSIFINTLIEYNDADQAIVSENYKSHYIFQKDIEILISCANTEDKNNSEVVYTTKIINLPQCLNELDSIHGFGIHKINFYDDIDIIIYDIYGDPRLKSFRDVGISFSQIEQYFMGLLFLQIKLKSESEYIVPKANTIYLNVTHIRFQRVISHYVPYFKRPFYLKYRLTEFSNNNEIITNRMTSNLCFFQIKFFPYNMTKYQGNGQGQGESSDFSNSTMEENPIIPENLPECKVDLCAICSENNENSCKFCDISEISSIIIETYSENKTYNKCICDNNLGFLKEPNLKYGICLCQEDYYYYKSMELCWPKEILEEGPYFIETLDDYFKTPIYDDCYYTCKKCSKGKDEKSHNCLKCQDGYAYIDDDISNCYDINELIEGFHQIEEDHFIRCHNNCISCIQKPEINLEKNKEKEFCTECQGFAPYMLKDNFLDESFNCLEKKCDLNYPAFLYAYDKESYECLRDCENGVQPYNDTQICWKNCGQNFIFLEKKSKKCYINCYLNGNQNTFSNYAIGLCSDKCLDSESQDKICYECNGDKNKYKNKKGECTQIPKECLIVDINTDLCKVCNNGYYPLKEDIEKESFNCYESIDEIIEKNNKSNFYFNETGKFWDECYESCATCDFYGSENRQRCKTCKLGYHFPCYLENKYSNCKKDINSYQNCTSSQEDIYKYKDYCHFCKEGYSFVYNTNKCMLDEDIKNNPFYEDKIEIVKDYNKNETIIVKIFYPCHKNCKKCKEKGDSYDNKCLECKKGYYFDTNSQNKTCLKSDEEDEYELDEDGEKIWFKLGSDIFYFYRIKKCFFIFYDNKIFLVSNKTICNSLCYDWTNNIEKSSCKLKKYTAFKNMTRDHFNNLINNTEYIYDEIKSNVSIIYKKSNDLIFHLTNFVSESPKYLSSIHIDEYMPEIKNIFNITDGKILSMKVDIKQEKKQSTQVEYQFYNPNTFANISLNDLFKRRRLDGENKDEEKLKLKIDLPINWTDQQRLNIKELTEKNINIFNTSSEFYTDNCNQYTNAKKSDVFLEQRKKEYYPDIELCEKGCIFVNYDVNTEKVTCQCDYKIDTNNYESVTFEKNPLDEKFKKKHIFENLQSMKCLSLIFKPENLKKNPGFIIMILFVFIFVGAGLFYFLTGRLVSFKNQILNIDFEGKNLHESPEEVDKKKEEENIKNQENANNNNDSNENKVLKNTNSQSNEQPNNNINNLDEGDNNNNNNNNHLVDGSINNNSNNNNENKDLINSTLSKDEGRKEGTLAINKSKDNKEKNKDLIEDEVIQVNKNKNKSKKSEGSEGGNDGSGKSENSNKVINSDEMISKDMSYHDYSRDNDDYKYNGDIPKEIVDKNIDKVEKEDDDLEFGQDLQIFESNIKMNNNQNQEINNHNKNKDNEEEIPEKNIKLSISHSQNNNNNNNNNQDDNKTNRINIRDSHLSQENGFQHLDYSKDSKLKEKDERISEYDLESVANPPLRKNEKNNNILSSPKSNDHFCSERNFFRESKNTIYHFNKKKNNCSCSCFSNIKNCLLSCGKYDSERNFKKLYQDDLKKHHILYYTFSNCGNKDQFFLKLSFLAFYFHLYFGLNTILTFNLSMAESYFDRAMAKPGYRAMNLLLPFVICALICFAIKLIIMPQYFYARAENKFRNNEYLKSLKNINNAKDTIKINVEKKEEKKVPQKGRKRGIKNIKFNKESEEERSLEKSLNRGNIQYENQKKIFLESIYSLYKNIIIIYFVVCFLVMTFNWYMMTSFCSIYRNTGVKLIANSFMSIFASLIIPLILAIIPSFVGYIGYKIGNKLIIKIYEIINFII